MVDLWKWRVLLWSTCQDTYIGTWNPNVDVDCHIANSGERVSAINFRPRVFKAILMGLVDANDRRIKNFNILNQNIRVKLLMGTVGIDKPLLTAKKKRKAMPLLSSEHGRYYIQLQELRSLKRKRLRMYLIAT